MGALGDRMKGYEGCAARSLTRRIPVIVRVDGRAFHGWTRSLDKPFDKSFISAMVSAARSTANEIQGCRLAYVQSDEASFLLTDYAQLQTEPWLGYNLAKVASLSAALMSVTFNQSRLVSLTKMGIWPHFDSRAFNVPREEVSNYFLWRAKDWHRNSVQMYSRSFFSQKELHGKGHEEMHEMLHGIGKNWATDLDDQARNGTWIVDSDQRCDILPSWESVSAAVEPIAAIGEPR